MRSAWGEGLYRRSPPLQTGLALRLLVSLALGGLGALLADAAGSGGADPCHTAAWFPSAEPLASMASLGLGGAVAVGTIAAFRLALRRGGRALALALALKASASPSPWLATAALALVGGASEELFFRAFLVPFAGVCVSSLLFGLVHQVRGPGRLLFIASATFLGLLLGTVYMATGSLVGPVVAHVTINLVHLHMLGRLSERAATPPSVSSPSPRGALPLRRASARARG